MKRYLVKAWTFRFEPDSQDLSLFFVSLFLVGLFLVSLFIAVMSRLDAYTVMNLPIINPSKLQHKDVGKYQGTQLDSLSAGDTIRVGAV